MDINILLAEDDFNLGYVLVDQLRQDGYNVTLATDGSDALKRFNEKVFHLCIFDVMMPLKDGFSLSRDIRKINSDIPILFLSAKSMIEDKLEGFNSGGDDYLTKPFSVEELQLRIRALLRRVNIKVDKPEDKTIQLGLFLFDSENNYLTISGNKKPLTKKESQILKLLIKFKGQVLSREVILTTVWGQNDYFVGRSLDVFITKLRKYLRDDATIIILNIHGVGFKLAVEE